MVPAFSEPLKPRCVNVDPVSDTCSRVTIEPLDRGFGHTLGNALRRVLLSSMPGCAVVEVEINGVLHEYTTIEGVQEDVIDVFLNLKGLAIHIHTGDEAVLKLSKRGPATVLASDIVVSHDVEIANPNHVIANLTEAGELEMTMKVQRGRGYRPIVASNVSDVEQKIGNLKLDASFSPIKRVTYECRAHVLSSALTLID